MNRRSLSELLKTKKDYELASRGADVLEKVENALTKELLFLDTRVKTINSGISAMMNEIMKELEQAKQDSLLIDIETAISEEPLDNEVGMTTRKKFGKLVPQMQPVSPVKKPPRWGTPFAYERARDISGNLLTRIVELGNVQTQREFVAQELAKTRRRVNALRRIIIPDLKAKRKDLEEWMDEETREELGRRHWVEEVMGR